MAGQTTLVTIVVPASFGFPPVQLNEHGNVSLAEILNKTLEKCSISPATRREYGLYTKNSSESLLETTKLSEASVSSKRNFLSHKK